MSRFYWVEADMFDDTPTGFDTLEQAVEAETTAWSEYILEDEYPESGEIRTKECLFLYCDNEQEDAMGDALIVHEVAVEIEYEHYHGDLEEHGLTMRDVL